MRNDPTACNLPMTIRKATTSRVGWMGARRGIYIPKNHVTKAALERADELNLTNFDTYGWVWLYNKLDEMKGFSSSGAAYAKYMSIVAPLLREAFPEENIDQRRPREGQKTNDLFRLLFEALPYAYLSTWSIAREKAFVGTPTPPQDMIPAYTLGGGR